MMACGFMKAIDTRESVARSIYFLAVHKPFLIWITLWLGQDTNKYPLLFGMRWPHRDRYEKDFSHGGLDLHSDLKL